MNECTLQHLQAKKKKKKNKLVPKEKHWSNLVKTSQILTFSSFSQMLLQGQGHANPSPSSISIIHPSFSSFSHSVCLLS